MRILKKLIRAALFRLKAIVKRMPRTKQTIKRILYYGGVGKNKKNIIKDDIAYEESLLLELVSINISLNKELYPDSCKPQDKPMAIKMDNLKNVHVLENLKLKGPGKIHEARTYLKELRDLTKAITRENYILLLEKQRSTNKA